MGRRSMTAGCEGSGMPRMCEAGGRTWPTASRSNKASSYRWPGVGHAGEAAGYILRRNMVGPLATVRWPYNNFGWRLEKDSSGILE